MNYDQIKDQLIRQKKINELLEKNIRLIDTRLDQLDSKINQLLTLIELEGQINKLQTERMESISARCDTLSSRINMRPIQ